MITSKYGNFMYFGWFMDGLWMVYGWFMDGFGWFMVFEHP
jgi:hypothetical protein